MVCDGRCRRPSPAQAHCGACHTTFGGVTGFDDHRKGGQCAHPATLGMVARSGVWRRPMPTAVAALLTAIRDGEDA